MKEDINLVLEKKEVSKTSGNLFYISLAFFSVTIFIAFSIILISFFLHSRLSNLSKEADSVRSKIAEQALRRDKLLLTSERVSAIKTILPSRTKLSDTVSNMLSDIPQDFLILGFNADPATVELSMSSPSLASYENLFTNVIPAISKNKANGVKSVQVTTFSQNGSSYDLGLNFLMKGAQ